jgi:hypothetical protein
VLGPTKRPRLTRQVPLAPPPRGREAGARGELERLCKALFRRSEYQRPTSDEVGMRESMTCA